jgi:hypothetical protein
MIIIIPGWLISLVTFPGVILHEVGHRFFCDIWNIPVYGVRYFVPFSKTAGCVVHGHTQDLKPTFFIVMGPLIVNTLLAMVLFIPAAYYYTIFEDNIIRSGITSILFMTWAGGSICMHALPSSTDLIQLCDILHSNENKRPIHLFLILVTYFLRACAYVNILSGFIYTVFIFGLVVFTTLIIELIFFAMHQILI